MPNISGNFDKRKGIIIEIEVAAAGSFGSITKGQKDLKVVRLPALVDTGATNTCLSPAIIKELEIAAVGKTEVLAASGIHPTNIYRVDLMLMYGPHRLLQPDIQVTKFNAPRNSPVQALLGLDILGEGVLTVSFDGHFTLSH